MSALDILDNPHSDRVKKVAQLTRRAGRRKQGAFLAEGPQPVREALDLWLRTWSDAPESGSGLGTGADGGAERIGAQLTHPHYLPTLDALYFDPAALDQHPDLGLLIGQLREVLAANRKQLPHEARVFVREATPAALAGMGDAETSQGIIAVCRTPSVEFEGLDSLLVGFSEQTMVVDAESTGSAYPAVDYPPVDLAVLLMHTQDPGNVGTLIRTADATGAGLVALTPGSADPWAPKVVRAAAGSHFHIPVATGIDPQQLTVFLRNNGRHILAAHGGADTSLASLTDEQLAQPTLWMLGNEAHGFTQEQLALADTAVSIPLYGQAESLNVAVAGAVCLYASAMAQEQGRS